MAIPQFHPASVRPARIVPRRTRTAGLKLVPDFDIFASERSDRQGFSVILIAIFLVGLLGLLAINTLLTQDAFVLQRLKHQTNVTNDQRDAIMQLVALKSSPDKVAMAAIKLGMISATNPEFLDITKVAPEAAVVVPTKPSIGPFKSKRDSRLRIKVGH